MLRRKPTAIKLTTNDLATYDDAKRARDEKARNAEKKAELERGGAIDFRLRARLREERLGLGGGVGGERSGR